VVVVAKGEVEMVVGGGRGRGREEDVGGGGGDEEGVDDGCGLRGGKAWMELMEARRLRAKVWRCIV